MSTNTSDLMEKVYDLFSSIAQLILTQAMPVMADAMASLGSAKTASKDFDTTLGSFDGEFQFHPVYGSPQDWYDPEAQDNGTLHTIGEQIAQPSEATHSPRPTSPVIKNRPTWGVAPVEMQSTLSQPIAFAANLADAPDL